VLVTQDMLGLTGGFHPKFVKAFANLAEQASQAIGKYIAEVQDGTFPDDAHSHG
jgi:3-methyl-2-oxobutanoate hydroxymethyltransferase